MYVHSCCMIASFCRSEAALPRREPTSITNRILSGRPSM
jgi:hypothetical protein